MTETSTKLKWAKVKPQAIVPTKRKEDAGMDIYACIEEDVVIQPHTIELIPTGIASAFSSAYCGIFKERGSTGTKGLSVRAGVIDSGYRGEWFVPINNTTNKTVILSVYEEMTERRLCEEHFHPATPESTEEYINKHYTIYPIRKAIAQVVFYVVPELTASEIPYDDLLLIESDRILGKLGDSKK